MSLVYLSGPMSGVLDHNAPAFARAASDLREAGHAVISPAEMTISRFGSWAAAEAVPWHDHVLYDLAVIAERRPDVVATLVGWDGSHGASTEVDFAKGLGIPVRSVSEVGLAGPEARRTEFDSMAARGPLRAPEFDRLVEAAGYRPIVADGVRSFAGVGGDLDVTTTTLYESSVVADASGALKADGGKPRLDLVPYLPTLEAAKVLTFGAQKYDDHNWRKGFPFSRIKSSLDRHLGAWWNGEDLDPETGITHLAHARCNVDFLLEFVLTGTGTDDRFRR